MEDTTQKVHPIANGSPIDYQLTIRLLEMVKRTKYELVQENGQRRLTAPEIVRGEKQRMKGAEIFLGRLPRDCYEDELMPMLEKIGRLCELRLMLDFSGSTRGYAFALFENANIAKEACAKLDGYEIRPGHRIGVVKSVDNCRLFFGGVPKDKTKEEFMQELTKMLDGITDVYLYPSSYDKTLNRGFIFVEFKDHRAAAMARRKLIPGRVILWDHEVAVDWADPEPGDPIDDEIMKNVTALFVRNLPFDMSQQRVRDLFQKATEIPILKLKKINHFAFVHYETRQAAETVMNIMTKRNGVAEAEGWEIRWAKPIGATKVLERQQCINEAVAQSSQYKSARCPTKKSDVKPNIDINFNNVMDVAEVHMSSLQHFVKNKFDAVCLFNCIPFAPTAGYLCKITIFKHTIVLFEYHGEPKPTKQDAVIAACTKIKDLISTTYQNWTLQKAEQLSMVQKPHLNPVVGASVSWNGE